MARSVYMCGDSELYLAHCDPCDELESRVGQLEECCDEAKATLSDHGTRITDLEENKQDKLTAGDNIKITDNVISADGLVEQDVFNEDMQAIAKVDNDQCERITALETCCQTVNNKFNDYYTKTQTYTQQEVLNLLADLDGIHFEVVSTLPTTGDENVIYILSSDNNSLWIYSNNNWEQIGDTSIDLSQYLKISDAIDLFHPVGDTIIRTDNTDPSTLYSGTTWQKISEGRMLIGANATYPLGTTGGDATVPYTPSGTVGNTTLTAAQSGIPAHTHGFTQPSVTGGGGTNNITGGSHRHVFQNSSGQSFDALVVSHGGNVHVNGTGRLMPSSGGSNYFVYSSANIEISEWDGVSPSTHTHNLPAHSHSVSGGAVGAVTGGAQSASSAHNHSFTGTAANINNMPPYLAVNIWIRTA